MSLNVENLVRTMLLGGCATIIALSIVELAREAVGGSGSRDRQGSVEVAGGSGELAIILLLDGDGKIDRLIVRGGELSPKDLADLP